MARYVALVALPLLFALSGCLVDDDPIDPGLTDDEAKNCTTEEQTVPDWSESGLQRDASGTESFVVPNGTRFLDVTSGLTNVVAADWKLQVHRSDGTVYASGSNSQNTVGAAPIIGSVGGPGNRETTPQEGTYEMEWRVDGYVEEIRMVAIVGVCA